MNLKENWTIPHIYWEQLPPMQSMHNPISGSSRKSAAIYSPFVNGIDGNYEEKMAQFKRENYCVNYYFFENFSKKKNLDDILRKGQPITLKGIISKAVIERRIEQLLEFEFKRWDISHIEEQKICKIKDMECLIQGASLFIKKIFIDDYYLFGR